MVCGDSGFRYGSILWTSSGNNVNFTIISAFQQVVANVTIGDVIQLTGQESPQFLYGDSQLVQILSMTVTSYSLQRQWIMGEIHLEHQYSSPVSPDGTPWNAQFIGCCRLSDLQNNAGKPWVLTAELNLNLANKSPKPKILPLITIPLSNGSTPSVTVASDDFEQVEWSLGVPFDVGGSVHIVPISPAQSSYLTVDVGKLYSDSNNTSLNCVQLSSSPGCLFQLLQARPSPALMGFSVEGWVKSTSSDLSTIFSTSMASTTNCADITLPCSIATL